MDTENTPVEQVAPANNETQSEQVAETETPAQAPETASEQAEKLYAGKFKSPEELEHSYQELQSKFTKTAQEKAELERLSQQISQQVPEQGYSDAPQLDPEVLPALDNWYQQRRQAEKIQEARAITQRFLAEHENELQDDVLAGTLGRLINREEGANRPINHEALLQEAKAMLDERVKPAVRQAQVQTEQEAAKIAQDKVRMGAVGETPATPPLDENALTADEWAKLKGIPRVSGE